MTRSRTGFKQDHPAATRRLIWILIVGGFALVAGLWRVRVLSNDFIYGSSMLERPILEFVAIMVGLGLVHVTAVALVLRARTIAWQVLFILVLGVGMRVLFVGTNPILEDDHYRYRWDGAMTAHGYNPYTIVPSGALSSADPDVAALARQSGDVIERVNHPELTTVYPPVAQAVFAVAHFVKPWSLNAWRGVVIGVEFVICALLLLMLHWAQRPLHWILIYWWNPLAVVTAVNAGHMDVVVLPFILAAVLFAIRNRAIAACVAGALAIGAKLWPLVLAPIVLRNLRATPAQIGIAIIFGGAVLLAVGSPMYATIDQRGESGLAAYGSQWEMNDALFMVILEAVRMPAGSGPQEAQTIARIVVAAVVLVLVALFSIQHASDSAAVVNRLTIVMGVMFMLLPAQFPWYYLWVLPFLVVAPRASLLSLTATLPLYYLKFWYAAKDNVDFFHTRIVWIEYAPCLILAAVEFVRFLLGSRTRA